MKNLATYYGSAPPNGPKVGPWSAGPQFFFTPKHFSVLTPPNKRGVHAASFNGLSWGVEMVGDFDREELEGSLRKWYVEGLACLHIATGLKVGPYEYATQGLHFHRDDPLTNKTCPGKSITKAPLIQEITAKIEEMTGGDGPTEQVVVASKPKTKLAGIVKTDGLSVRAGASAKTPVIRTLKSGAAIDVIGEAMNGDTRWLNIAPGEWVAARFVSLQA
jgi:hypothetical protein